jgi:phosphohistidine phosphatase
MDLYLIRHADAGSREEWQGDDVSRALTPLGVKQAHALGEALSQRGISFDAILTSPYIRAAQTASEIMEAMNSEHTNLEACELLTPDELRPRKLTKLLAGMEHNSIAIVGHDPDLPAYLAWLLGIEADCLRLEKGGAALVRFEGEPEKGGGSLAWIVTPEWFMAEVEETAGV